MPPKRKRAPPAPASEPGSPPSRASSELREEEEEEQEEAEQEEEQPDAPDASSLFYNTTFSAYRVSPLHVGREALDAAAFQTLSKRLRDTLVGDVVRGVQVGLASDDGTLGRAGALDSVAWRWVALADLLGIDGGDDNNDNNDDDDDDGRGDRDGSADLGARDNDTDEEGTTTAGRGRRKEEKARRKSTTAQALAVELEYENAAFSALLLPDFFAAPPAGQDGGSGGGTWTSHSSIPAPPPPKPDTTSAPGRQFHHLPLLLLRMPVPLKSVVIEFLCRTFDARIAPLRLGTRTLVSSWERWLALSGARAVRRLNKDVALTLGFHLEPPRPDDGGGGGDGGDGPAPEPTAKKAGKSTTQQPLGLRTLDLIIPAPDVHRFLRAGTTDLAAETSAKNDDGPLSPSRRRQLAGGLDDEGWSWRAPTLDSSSPPSHPFTEALRAYLDAHLALDLFHPGVRILKIACDGFSLAEGRVKLFRPASPAAADAAWHIVGHLVEKARGRTDWMAVSFCS